MKNRPCRTPARRLLAGLIACAYAGVAGAQPAPGPSVADTNKVIQVHNAYRNLLAANLVWKLAATEECKSVRLRVAMVAQPIALLDPATARPNEEAWINMQQRSEENSLTQTAVIGPLLVEALGADCLVLPSPLAQPEAAPGATKP